jgi:nucleoside-diphosphate-sugar epimerase
MYEDIPVGSGQAVSVRHFAETACALAGSDTRLEFGALPYRDNEPMFCQADTTRLQSLGWRPQYDLAGGIRQTIQLEKSS